MVQTIKSVCGTSTPIIFSTSFHFCVRFCEDFDCHLQISPFGSREVTISTLKSEISISLPQSGITWLYIERNFISKLYQRKSKNQLNQRSKLCILRVPRKRYHIPDIPHPGNKHDQPFKP